MAERIVPEAGLTAVAAPVDRYVAPRMEVAPETNPMLQLASDLSRFNPELMKFLNKGHENYVQTETAAGMNAEAQIDHGLKLEENRQGWKSLIDQQRQVDKAEGTAHADKLASASPHFRRGLLTARAKRIAMGVNDRLMMEWSKNPQVEVNGAMVNLHEVDDPQVLAEWAQQRSAELSEEFGISSLDPVLVQEAYAPIVLQAQDQLATRQTGMRLERYQTEYLAEMSAGVSLSLTGYATGGSDIDSFIHRISGSESSGNWGARNNAPGAGGKGHFGYIQFGRARFEEAKAAGAVPADMTIEEFGSDTPEGRAAQMAASRWHFQDIDAFIQRQGFLDKGYSLDGMRAVAHLGGKEGLRKFIMSGGQYDPDDSYQRPDGTWTKGTKLSDYYARYSGPVAELQETLDTAVNNGVNPTKANEIIVNAVITNAINQRDPAMLEVLKDISTGSGQLGNVGWVKAKVQAAQDRISDLVWQEESREYTREQREREQRTIELNTEATRAILENPYGDISELQQQAIDAGLPDLAKTMATLQETMIDRDYKVRPNHERITQLRIGITTGEITDEEFLQALRNEAGINFPASVALQLMDDFNNRDRYTDTFADRQVQAAISAAGRYVSELFAYNDGMVRVPGTAKGQEAEAFIRNNVIDFIKDNPEAGVSAVRDFTYKQLEFIQKSPIWKPTPTENPDYTPDAQRAFGDVTALTGAVVVALRDPSTLSEEQALLITQAAAAAGMSAQEYLQQFGSN